MTNEEVFKIPRVRARRFIRHCQQTGEELSIFRAMSWLSEKFETEEPLCCPFCTSETVAQEVAGGFAVQCTNPRCFYRAGTEDSKEAAIVAHNELFGSALEGRMHSIRVLHDQKVEGGQQGELIGMAN